MEVLVAGGTGFIGRHLVRELVERGHSVVALSRDPDPSKLPEAVTCRSGDVTTFDGLTDAIAGVDGIVNLVALSPLYRPSGGERAHERVHVQGTRNLVRAMDAAGVERLVQVSGVGADPDAATAYLRAKGRAERIVRSASCDHTILRPTVVFGDGGEFVPFVRRVTTPYLTGLPGGGRMRFQPIWVGDVAPLFGAAITEERHVGATYEIGGAEVLTLAAITRSVHAADGRSVRIVPIPMPLVGTAFTVAGPLPGIPFGRDQYRALGEDTTVDENDIERLGGSTASCRTLESYLSDSAPE